VGVFIVNYNGLAALGRDLVRCVESVVSSDYGDKEVFFLDNGSSDGSPDLVEKLFGGSVRVLRLSRNVGYAGAGRIVARLSRGFDYVVVMNNDIVVDRMWLRNAIDVMERFPRIGAAQPLILNPDGSIQSLGCFMGSLGTSCLLGSGQRMDLDKLGRLDYIPCTYAHGSVVISRARAMSEVGGFDPSYFMYFEEVEYCLKLWSRGWWVVAIPRSVVYHLGAATVRTFRPRAVKLVSRNHVITIAKMCRGAVECLPRIALATAIRVLKTLAISVKNRSPHALHECIQGIVEGIAIGLKRVRTIEPSPQLKALTRIFRDALSLIPQHRRNPCRVEPSGHPH